MSRSLFLSIIVLICLMVVVPAATAKIISVTLANATSGSPGRMVPTDLAGAPGLRAANWNLLTNANLILGDNEAVVYDDGTSADAVRIAITTPRSFSNRDNNSSYQNDQIMYNGVIDCYGDITTLTLTNVPFAQYDVYFYMRDDGGSRAGGFTLVGGPAYYLRGTTGNPTADGNGYVLSTDTTMTAGDGTSIDPGNYTVFQSLSGDNTFQVTAVNAGDATMRNKWAGFQIVETTEPTKAGKPWPADKATDVPRSVILSWMPSDFAVAHDVYLGTSFEDVNTAGRIDGKNALISRGQDANSCDPTGILQFGQTYYWRVDEVNGAPDNTLYKGYVWRFTVEPYSLVVTGVTATASGSSKPESGPERTVDSSGLDPSTGEHGTISEDGWISATGTPQWIQYELPEVCRLDKMLVWNSNQAMEPSLGLGARDVTIEYSLDGAAWTTLGVFEFARALGAIGYTANTTVDFAGAVSRFVKLTISSNWGGLLQQYGLSEVRFYSVPVLAREPKPSPDSTNLHPQVAMSWRAGREAVSHELYIGTDPNAVTGGAVAPVTATQPQYDFAADLGQTYHWRVVEVNQAQDPTSWAGPVWSFSTTASIVVDDFEGYTNNSPKRVFQAWIDGEGFSPDEFFPNGGTGNGSGSYVGHDPALGNIMETALFYGGRQSMPVYYDNSAAPKISEAVRTLDPARDTTDWSKHGLTTLVVWFRGDSANGAAPIYVKINNSKKVYNNGAAATTTAVWKPFQIDLASIPAADLKAVKTITIGVGDGSAGGTGKILVDEIRLYAAAPAMAVPTDPGVNGLEALYSMEGDVRDSSGKGHDGTANGDPGYVDGPAGYGKAMAFDGINDYADLPIGNLINTLGGSTFATRVNFSNSGGNWQRILDFGRPPASGNPNTYMFLSPRQASTGSMRFAIRTAAVTERVSDGPVTLPSGWHHVAVVFDEAAMLIRLYMDGVEVDNSPTTLLPRDLGVTTQNWLGRSQWSGDAYYTGSLDDVRIYSRPLSEGEVRYLAGDR